MEAGTKSILIVDDSRLFLDLEGTFLVDSGYEILKAASGQEALETTRKHRPDLILLDLNMPGMEGDQVCRTIKGDPELKDITVIMITAADRQEDRVRCIQAGCDGYLTKTVNRSDLLSCVARGLNDSVRYETRLPMNIKVHYKVDDQTEEMGLTLNISANGMFIITELPPEVGTRLAVDFRLPELDEDFHIQAEVVWNTFRTNRGMPVKGFGIRFERGDIEALDRIARYTGEGEEEGKR